MRRIDILGVPVDPVTGEEAIQKITGFLRSKGQFHIATPNPEMLVEAQRNPAFREVLQKTSLNLPDGIGLVWAMHRALWKQTQKQGSFLFFVFCFSLRRSWKFLGEENEQRTLRCHSGQETKNEKRPVQRVTGTDTLLALCASPSRISPPEKIFLLGAAPGIAERAAEVLKAINPALKIAETFAGSPKEEEERTILERINAARPTLLFVAYGAPQQDLWIARNLSKMPSVKVAMGVGGAFDFIAGKQRRAPRIFQSTGLEWLWRVMREPKRVKRIWRAVVVFPWMVMTQGKK